MRLPRSISVVHLLAAGSRGHCRQPGSRYEGQSGGEMRYLLALAAAMVLAGCGNAATSQPAPAKTVTQHVTATPAPTVTHTVMPTATSTPQAAPSQSQTPCTDACGAQEPAIYPGVTSGNGQPTTLTFGAENVVSNIVWQNWPTAPNGALPANATATGTGTITLSNCNPSCENPSSSSPGTATVTLSNPQDQTPTIWGTVTEVVNAPGGGTYTLPTSQVPAS